MRRKKFLITIWIFLMVFCRTASASEIEEYVFFPANSEYVSFDLQVRIGKMPQFDENRLEKLNDIAKHFLFTGVISDRFSEITALMDKKQMFTLIKQERGGKDISILAPDQKNYYIIPEDNDSQIFGMDFVSGILLNVMTNKEYYFALDKISDLFHSLSDMYSEKSGITKINENYKYYGKAVKKTKLTLTEEEFERAVETLNNDSSNNTILKNLCGFDFQNRQNVTMLTDENNRLVRLAYSGKVVVTEEDVRNVRLEWKTVRSETLEKDELVLRTPDSTGKKRNNLILQYTWEEKEDGTESFIWSAERDFLADGIHTKGTTSIQLETDKQKELCGIITDSVSVKGVQNSTEIVISCSRPEKHQRLGTLEIISKNDTIEKGRIVLDFVMSSDELFVVSGDEPEALSVTYEEYSSIKNHLYRDILRNILALPEEDLTFLKESIPEESWVSVLNLAE